MSDLASKSCAACRGGVPPLRGEQIGPLLAQLDPGWRVEGEHHLKREFHFPDFAGALAFVNRVGALAEAEGHHPDIYLTWGKAAVSIWTHKIDGLSEADFILAAKIDREARASA